MFPAHAGVLTARRYRNLTHVNSAKLTFLGMSYTFTELADPVSVSKHCTASRARTGEYRGEDPAS